MPAGKTLTVILIAIMSVTAAGAQEQETKGIAPFVATGMFMRPHAVMVSGGATLWWPSYAAFSLDATVAGGGQGGTAINVGLQGRTAPFFLETGYVVGGVTYDADILRLVGGLGAQFAPATRSLALEAVIRSMGGNDQLLLLVRKSW